MLKRILNKEKFEKIENDKKEIQNLITNFDEKFSKELKDNFNFKVYGIDIILKNLRKETCINKITKERIEQFNRNLTSTNIDLSLYKTVQEMRGEWTYQNLLLYTEFVIDSTNLQVEINKILEYYS